MKRKTAMIWFLGFAFVTAISLSRTAAGEDSAANGNAGACGCYDAFQSPGAQSQLSERMQADGLIKCVKNIRSRMADMGKEVRRIQENIDDLKAIGSLDTVNLKSQRFAKFAADNDLKQRYGIDIDAAGAVTMKEKTQSLDALLRDIRTIQKKDLQAKQEGIALCEQDLAIAEQALREKARALLNNIKKLKAFSAQSTGDTLKQETVEERVAQEAQLQDISGTVCFTGDDLLQSFNDYEEFFFKFDVGYEYASVNSIFQRGFPRVGFMVLNRFFENPVPDHAPGAFGFQGLQHSLSVLLTSSAEQETTITNNQQPEVKNTGDNQALEFDMHFFLPVSRTAAFNGGKLRQYVGPIVVVGGMKVDADENGNPVDRVQYRKYAGIRSAINPELYADFLYGTTTGLQSERLEVRGQMPIHRFANGSRLFLGAIGNFGVKDKVAEEADVIRIYISWAVDFETIYNYFIGNQQ